MWKDTSGLDDGSDKHNPVAGAILLKSPRERNNVGGCSKSSERQKSRTFICKLRNQNGPEDP